MTKDALKLEAIRLAEIANRMVKSGELSKEKARSLLSFAVKELIARPCHPDKSGLRRFLNQKTAAQLHTAAFCERRVRTELRHPSN